MKRTKTFSASGVSDGRAWAKSTTITAGAPNRWQSWWLARRRHNDKSNIRHLYRNSELTVYRLVGEKPCRSYDEGIGTRTAHGFSYWLAAGRPRVVTRLGRVYEFEDGGVIVVSSLSAGSSRILDAIVADDLGELIGGDVSTGTPGESEGVQLLDEVEWREVHFSVDNQHVIFRLRENDKVWSSYADIGGGCFIRITGSGTSYGNLAIERV